jgi:EAL domain-containing protein (putative c-di-GMP-specific phosphodiesterase class I)
MKSRLMSSALAPSQVVIELIETNNVKDPESLTTAINDMKAWGAQIAIDDFGRSFSSLERLITIEADIFKLDGSLTDRIEQEKLAILVSKIVALANKLDMTVVAEGIETEDQLKALLSLGIDYGQGYFLGRPALPTTFASRTSAT